MNLRFIKWQLKEWLPLLTATLIIFFVSMVVPNMIATNYSRLPEGGGWVLTTPLLGNFVITPMLFAFFLPNFVLDYRFNKRKSDIFYQLPLKERELKNTRIILALVSLLILFTVTFFAGTLVTLAHQMSERTRILNSHPEAVLGLYNYGYYIFFYLCLLFIISGEYFVSLFFANLGSSSRSACMNSICGNAVLFLLIASFFMFIRTCMKSPDDTFPNSLDQLLTYSFCLNLHPSCLAANVTYAFSSGIKDGVFDMMVPASYYIPFIILDAVVIIAAAVYMLYTKDPSGEHSGSFVARKEWMNYIIHITAFVLSSYDLLTSTFDVWLFIYATIYVVFEYLIICSTRKTFHLKKIDFILLGIQFVWFFIPYAIKRESAIRSDDDCNFLLLC